MSNNKQTAVEWLEELIECGADLEQIKKCLHHAKEMEKLTMINALIEFSKAHLIIHTEEAILNITRRAEKYYNETYGGNK